MKMEHEVVQVSAEMEEVFVARAKLHRSLVKKNLLMMQGYLGLSKELLHKTADLHDLSKYESSERVAYIWMTWMYHCKSEGISFQYPIDIEAVVQQGWQHHITHNAHHPESHADLNQMSFLDIVEMVCDWTAISQENTPNNPSAMAWAIDNLDKKWNFSDLQKKLIFSTIEELDKRNQKFANQQRGGGFESAS